MPVSTTLPEQLPPDWPSLGLDFVIDGEGRPRFKSVCLASRREPFARAGVDIRRIRTWRDYLYARRVAEPHFFAVLRESLLAEKLTGRERLERDLVLAISDEDDVAAENLERRLDWLRATGEGLGPETSC